jgi:hypothetical protein
MLPHHVLKSEAIRGGSHVLTVIAGIAAITFTAVSILFQLLDFLKVKHRRWFAGLAIACSFLALFGQWYDHRESTEVRVELDSIGVEQTEWFQVPEMAGNFKCELSHPPLSNSVSVLINGLKEPPDVYSIGDKSVTVLGPFGVPPNAINITYRHKR